MFSALDDRYSTDLEPLQLFFGEEAYIRQKVQVEKDYLFWLTNQSPELEVFMKETPDIQRIKEIEQEIRHDTKAIEVYLQERLRSHLLEKYIPWVHWGLTSWDIISVSSTKLLYDSSFVLIEEAVYLLHKFQLDTKIVFLGRTHGQPATPIKVRNFFGFYWSRLQKQINTIQQSILDLTVKFGGTVGEFHIHKTLLNGKYMKEYFDDFITDHYHLTRSEHTTQIDAYDSWIRLFQNMQLLSGILLDFVKNVWGYISLGVFIQKVVQKEVGSSVMPHKVNPIQWENAEGNLKIAIGFFQTFISSLVESRYQRDMSDSTIIRNIGVPIAHLYLAMKMIDRGFSRLDFNEEQMTKELEEHYEVLTELIQHVFRIHNINNAYDVMKKYTRGQQMNQQEYYALIDKLEEEINNKDVCWKEIREWTPIQYGRHELKYKKIVVDFRGQDE